MATLVMANVNCTSDNVDIRMLVVDLEIELSGMPNSSNWIDVEKMSHPAVKRL